MTCPKTVPKMLTFCRYYHVSFTAYSIKKQSIKLCKMVNPKAKRQWYPAHSQEANELPSVKSLTKIKYEPGKSAARRVAMLNKMFMKQITDLMSTGTVALDIVGRGIEISKVQVTPDFQTVNVFWVCKGNSSDKETEIVLNKAAGALRHELSILRVMGVVPYIVFVKDKHESQLVDLDRRLAIADYGDDYTLTEIGHLLKTEFTLDTKLSSEMKAKIKQLEEEQSLIEEPLPEMTHNVYGLDHAKVMNRLLAARKKTRDAWSNLEVDNDVITYRTPEHKLTEVDVGDQRQELAEFLLKRQILQNKLAKQMRRPDEEWQVAPDKEDPDDDIYEDSDDEYYEDDLYYDNSYIENNKDSKTVN